MRRLPVWLAKPWAGMLVAVLAAALLRYPLLGTIPPGLSFDEAGNGVAALEVAQGQFRLWWPIGGGAEPLMAYLVQPLMWLFGPTTLALRLYAATMGLVTVAATYWLAWEMFAASSSSGRDSNDFVPYSLIPVFAALGLATAFWHVAYSRVAFRALAMPAVEALAMAWLWRGLRKAGPATAHIKYGGAFVGAGFLIGLGAYTYPPGRFVPIVLLLFFALEALLAKWRAERPLLMRHLVGLILCAGVAALTFSPLALFFAQNPGAFVERARATSIFNPVWNQGHVVATLLRTGAQTLGTFLALSGDANPMGNLHGRPLLGPFLAVLFGLGLVVSLLRVVSAPSPARSAHLIAGDGQSAPVVPLHLSPAPYLFLLCWWLVMLIPAILAPEGAPHHLRLIGAAPATYILVAIGLQQGLGLFVPVISRSRLPFRPVRQLVVIVSLLMFTVIGLVTARTYFVIWRQLPELYMAFDVYAVELAQQMAGESDPSVVYVIPMDLRAAHEARHYTLDFLYRGQVPYQYLPVDEATVGAQLTNAAAGHDTLLLVQWLKDKHVAADEREAVTFLLSSAARLVDEVTYPVYRVQTWALPSTRTTFALPPIQQEVQATFGGLLRLEGASVSGEEGAVGVALRWAPLAAMDVDYKVSLRLVKAGGEIAAQKDRFLRHNWHQGTSLWPPETVNEYYLLAPVLPGEYDLQVIVYHPETLMPLLANGSATVSLGAVTVE